VIENNTGLSELIELAEKAGMKNKPCKRNNRQISDNTKIAAKQGNAEERPDAGCEIKLWKAAAEMSSFFNIPPDISKADKPQGFGDRVPDSRPRPTTHHPTQPTPNRVN